MFAGERKESQAKIQAEDIVPYQGQNMSRGGLILPSKTNTEFRII